MKVFAILALFGALFLGRGRRASAAPAPSSPPRPGGPIPGVPADLQTAPRPPNGAGGGAQGGQAGGAGGRASGGAQGGQAGAAAGRVTPPDEWNMPPQGSIEQSKLQALAVKLEANLLRSPYLGYDARLARGFQQGAGLPMDGKYGPATANMVAVMLGRNAPPPQYPATAANRQRWAEYVAQATLTAR